MSSKYKLFLTYSYISLTNSVSLDKKYTRKTTVVTFLIEIFLFRYTKLTWWNHSGQRVQQPAIFFFVLTSNFEKQSSFFNPHYKPSTQNFPNLSFQYKTTQVGKKNKA